MVPDLAERVSTPVVVVAQDIALDEVVASQPGGKALMDWISQNRDLGSFVVVGSMAEKAKGETNPELLNHTQKWWKDHDDDYPYRKDEVIDLDMFLVVEESLTEADFKNIDGRLEMRFRTMKDGKTMLMVGEKLPESGDYFTRTSNRATSTWAEIVIVSGKSNFSEQLARQGYTTFTSAAEVQFVGDQISLNYANELKWIPGSELDRASEKVDASTIMDTMGKDTKYLKMAIKSLVNQALVYGKDIPIEIREDLASLLHDRVSLIQKDWHQYLVSNDMDVFRSDTLLLAGAGLADPMATNQFLFINVVERMIDGWVIMGNEATKMYEESGLIEMIFGVKTNAGENVRETMVKTIESETRMIDFKSPLQSDRLKAELEGLNKLLSSDDLVI